MSTFTRKQIIETAREFLGTPYSHQGRVNGVGIDCVGLVAEVCKIVGFEVQDHLNYSSQPSGILPRILRENGFIEKGLEEFLPGDLGVFYFAKPDLPQHIAIFSDYGMIHTWTRVRKVVEHAFNNKWKKRMTNVFEFPGVI